MREEFGNCIFLVQNHIGRGTVDRRRTESQMVDRPLSAVELDRRLLYCDEGNTIIGKGRKTSSVLIGFSFPRGWSFTFPSNYFLFHFPVRLFLRVNARVRYTVSTTYVSAWFKGGIFYIHVPVFGAYYLFYSWNNVKRCQRWISPHVHAKGN